MNSSSRRQRCYDHRLKELVRTSGDPSVATDLGIPRSIVTGWLHDFSPCVVSLDVLAMKEQELQLEVLNLRRRVRKLRALLRLLLALLRNSGFSLAKVRVPEGKAKAALMSAVDRTTSSSLFGLCCVSCVSHQLATIRGKARSGSVASATAPPVRGLLPISSLQKKSKASEERPRPMSTGRFS